jgi:hypothetical protein
MLECFIYSVITASTHPRVRSCHENVQTWLRRNQRLLSTTWLEYKHLNQTKKKSARINYIIICFPSQLMVKYHMATPRMNPSNEARLVA